MTIQTKSLDTTIERTHISLVGLPTSRVALGTWAIGGWMWGGTEESEAIATICGCGKTLPPARLFQTLGALTLLATAGALAARRFRLARGLVISQTLAVLAGWGYGHYPYAIAPSLTIAQAAAPVRAAAASVRASRARAVPGGPAAATVGMTAPPGCRGPDA